MIQPCQTHNRRKIHRRKNIRLVSIISRLPRKVAMLHAKWQRTNLRTKTNRTWNVPRSICCCMPGLLHATLTDTGCESRAHIARYVVRPKTYAHASYFVVFWRCWTSSDLTHIRQGLFPWDHGDWPLTRYVKLWIVHAPIIPGTFSVPPTSKEISS